MAAGRLTECRVRWATGLMTASLMLALVALVLAHFGNAILSPPPESAGPTQDDWGFGIVASSQTSSPRVTARRDFDARNAAEAGAIAQKFESLLKDAHSKVSVRVVLPSHDDRTRMLALGEAAGPREATVLNDDLVNLALVVGGSRHWAATAPINTLPGLALELLLLPKPEPYTFKKGLSNEDALRQLGALFGRLSGWATSAHAGTLGDLWLQMGLDASVNRFGLFPQLATGPTLPIMPISSGPFQLVLPLFGDAADPRLAGGTLAVSQQRNKQPQRPASPFRFPPTVP